MWTHQLPTITEYLTMINPIDDTPFRGSASTPAPIVNKDFQQMLTDFISCEYNNYHLRRICYDTEPEGIGARVQRICDNVYITHAYTYQHLYDTTVAVYNPIENYDMKENEKTQNSGTDKTERDIGSHTDSTNIGEVTATDIYGQDKTTHSGTENRAPFESQTYKNLNQSIASDTRDSRTDRHTQSQQSNSMTVGGRHDSDSLTHGHHIERELTRHGNIGVTTTQQMIEQERRIASMNLCRIVANDIIHAICICYQGVCL